MKEDYSAAPPIPFALAIAFSSLRIGGTVHLRSLLQVLFSCSKAANFSSLKDY